MPIAAARWDEALAAVEDAVGANRRLRDRFAELVFLDALCWVHRSRGEHGRAIAHGSEAVALAESLENPEWRAWTSATLGWALLEAGDAATAARHLEAGMAGAEATGARAQLLRCTALLVWASWQLGDGDRALALAGDAEAMIEAASAPEGRTFLLGAHAALAIARVLLASGAPERAEALVAPVLAAAKASGWVETVAYATLLEGGCGLALGRSEAGTAAVQESLELARAAELPWIEREAQAKLEDLRRQVAS